ncbi:hypothetical protein CBR_g29583 [Chara braunii]|uniref:Uncharacterized protein n=1 Tax=Chara braunii TaxID=69332 RepID=A0A388LAX4_CHABU|nr:hypothetical protein CBR_g29583 [Chara braunii]|eukprot:GBG79436.1 hypothetical protein CBR_g29583 [Chara braunii]
MTRASLSSEYTDFSPCYHEGGKFAAVEVEAGGDPRTVVKLVNAPAQQETVGEVGERPVTPVKVVGGELAGKGKSLGDLWKLDETSAMLCLFCEEDTMQANRHGRLKMWGKSLKREKYEWVVSKLIERGFRTRLVGECFEALQANKVLWPVRQDGELHRCAWRGYKSFTSDGLS